MSQKFETIVSNLIDAIKNSERQTTSAYDTTAEVVRVDGDTAWVHIAGGVTETPVRKTIACKAGDNVQVRVGGGDAWLTGNGTSPPTDDALAYEAQGTANYAVTQSEGARKIAADATAKVAAVLTEAREISKIAGDTVQHFWFTETGTDTGAHLTSVTESEFVADPANGGGNLLARTNGIAVRDGLTEVASFGETAIIGDTSRGDESKSHVEIGKDGLKVFCWETHYMPPHEEVIAEFGMASGDVVETTWLSWSNAWTHTLENTPATGASIKVYRTISSYVSLIATFTAGTAQTIEAITYDGSKTFSHGSSSLSAGSVSAFSYSAEVWPGGYASIGSRDPAYVKNANTATFGEMLVAEEEYQVATGYYNLTRDDNGESCDYAFMVGNGRADARSNALAVDWSGNLDIAGSLSQASDKRLKEHVYYLGNDSDEFIRSLKPAHYKKDDKNHVGFYAQDIEESDKWGCMTGEMNGYMTLNYIEIIAPLVAYCQHLEQRIEELENNK